MKEALTIEFSEEVWREFKKAAIDVDRPMRTIAVELIIEWLKKKKGT